MNFTDWAARHNVSPGAMAELRGILGAGISKPENDDSESKVQNDIRLEASKNGMWLSRNNVGATEAKTVMKCDRCQNVNVKHRQPVRYGLCNESSRQNKNMKSSDLIGIEPVVIRPEMVGHTIGRFLAREIKAGGWSYAGNPHEIAQLNFLTFIHSMGGNARFATGIGTL